MKFIKIRSPNRKLKIHHFFQLFLSLQPSKWSNGGKRLYQVNLCRSLTRLPIFIVLENQRLAKVQKNLQKNQTRQRTENPPPPNSPKESRSVPIISITDLCIIRKCVLFLMICLINVMRSRTGHGCALHARVVYVFW